MAKISWCLCSWPVSKVYNCVNMLLYLDKRSRIYIVFFGFVFIDFFKWK